MENSEKRTRYKLYLMYFLLFGGIAGYSPFLPHYFESKGLDYIQIGYCFSLMSIISIVSQPVLGYLADRWFGRKKTIILLMILCSISSVFFTYANTFYFICFCIVIIGFFQGAIFPLSDSYIYTISEHKKSIQYGKVRLFGSIGFALVAFGLGFLLKNSGPSIMFHTYSVLFILAAFFFSRVKFNFSTKSVLPKITDIGLILRNRSFSLFLLAVCVSSIAIISSGNYIAMLIEKTGGDTSGLGILWLLVAFSELPMFYLGTKVLDKFGEIPLFGAALILYSIRFILSSFCTSYILVTIIQLMQGVSYPLIMLSATSNANKLLPTNLKATGMTLISALGFGLGGFLGNLSSGFILENFNVFSLFRFYSLVSVIAFVIILIYWKRIGDSKVK